jgi:Domain of unknown function (DUF4293)
MIQRIQSIYLFVAAVAFGLQIVLPYAMAPANTPATTAPIFADGVFNLFDNVGMMGLTGLGIIDSILAIFMFKNRALQGRLVGMTIIVAIMLLVLVGFTFYMANKGLPEGAIVSYGAGFVLPLVATFLLWMASGAIKKDENLVKSMDRLR